MAHCLVQDNCQLILFSQNYHLNDHRWLLNVKLKLIKLITANGKYVIVLNTTYMQETEKQTQQKLHCVTLHTHKGYLIFLLNMYQSALFRYNRVKRLATPAFLHHDINCTWCWAVQSFNSAWWDKIFCWQLCSSITNPLLLSLVNQKSLDKKKTVSKFNGITSTSWTPLSPFGIHSDIDDSFCLASSQEIPSERNSFPVSIMNTRISNSKYWKLCLKSCGVTIQNENSLACSLIFFFLWVKELNKDTKQKLPQGKGGTPGRGYWHKREKANSSAWRIDCTFLSF